MTLTKNIKIDSAALQIIAAMQWEETPKGIVGRIMGGQLERKLYEATNKGLDALGGKWNRGLGGHVFSADPRQQIAAMLDTGVVVVEKDGFFRSPPAVVNEMIEMFSRSVELPILEPSAGDGAICDVLVNEWKILQSDIHVVEKNDLRRSQLVGKGYTVVGDDFLAFTPEEPYQTIIMNPPFEQGQDIQHIIYAFKICLATGGQLVSVVSEGPFFRSDSKSRQLIELIDRYGYSERLPEDSFEASGTGVATRLVYLRK